MTMYTGSKNTRFTLNKKPRIRTGDFGRVLRFDYIFCEKEKLDTTTKSLILAQDER